MIIPDLFDAERDVSRGTREGITAADGEDVPLAPGAMLLGGFASPINAALASALERLVDLAPFRHMLTPGGRKMSVAMTNCGSLGWVSDRSGYRYSDRDPESGRAWPPMPEVFSDLAGRAAARAGFADFVPDACLINRYEPGAKLSLHQDKDEPDRDAPIVSVSLGLPATFLFGGMQRTDPARRVSLTHGHVVVWGGPSRLRYHGIRPLEPGRHPLFGSARINLTFRKAR
jgi:alkylated DNA repair protein (DNA oxidative demethylase)